MHRGGLGAGHRYGRLQWARPSPAPQERLRAAMTRRTLCPPPHTHVRTHALHVHLRSRHGCGSHFAALHQQRVLPGASRGGRRQRRCWSGSPAPAPPEQRPGPGHPAGDATEALGTARGAAGACVHVRASRLRAHGGVEHLRGALCMCARRGSWRMGAWSACVVCCACCALPRPGRGEVPLSRTAFSVLPPVTTSTRRRSSGTSGGRSPLSPPPRRPGRVRCSVKGAGYYVGGLLFLYVCLSQ